MALRSRRINYQLSTFYFLLFLGLLLRLPGMRTDFWLDEIWSLFIVHHQVHSVADVFTVARVDNNHPLNTLLMYWLGDWADWWVYRIPALLAGLGAIAMAMRIGGRRGMPHAIAAGVLFAVSFPMILYSTEARGYGSLIFFKLWSIDVLDLYHLDGRASRRVTFAIAVILGCLANSIFVLGYAALFIWSACELADKTHWRIASRRLFLLHVVPIGFIVIYYIGFVLRLQVGGSSGATPAEVATQFLGFAVGLSNGVNGNVAAAIAALLLSVGILLIIRRIAPKLLALFIPGIWLIPASVLVAGALHGDRWLSPRHFLIAIVLLLLAAALAFGECWKRRGAWRIAASALLAGIVMANLFQDCRFNRLGRGHYLDALSFLLRSSDPNSTVTLSSDSPNRTQMILDFYWGYVPHDKPLQYIPPTDVARAQPNWYIGESESGVAPERVIDGLRYARRAAYPCYGLSGETWTICQRVAQ